MKKILTGLSSTQEYVCIALEELERPLRVWLSRNGSDFLFDVTDSHIFLGYKPLVIALVFDPDRLVTQESVFLNFCADGSDNAEKMLAQLKLKKFSEQKLDEKTVVYYEGVKGHHRFLKRQHQLINDYKQKLKPNKAGNVSLPGNLYDMVRIAYSIPRIISLISVSDGKNMNLVPTDLHGEVSSRYYISSLRKGGKANDQVEKLKKIVISEIDARAFNYAYALGKNHMIDLRPYEFFGCSEKRSQNFQNPLPTTVLRYRELFLTDSFDAGIHRIHVYETIFQEEVKTALTLAHIHQYYAQWRKDNRLSTNILVRK